MLLLRFALLTAVLALLSACGKPVTTETVAAPSPPPAAADSHRQIHTGEVIGFSAAPQTFAWLGIPYAQAPVGELRWRAPRPPEPWSGVREALQFGDFCPQFAGIGVPVDPALHGQLVGSEDCLFLNVWGPATAVKPRPVMVWIHGGGNSIGTASTYDFASHLAATRDVVVVTLNYRLGSLGWFSHPALQARPVDEAFARADSSGNYGTLDLIAALHWVQTNIAAFGGDPANVTIFGESAGGYNVYSLLLSPLAEGLFHKAIAQSGGIRSSSLAAAQNLTTATEPGDLNSSGELVVALAMQRFTELDRHRARLWAKKKDPDVLAQWLQELPLAELFAGIQPGRGMGMYHFPQLLTDGYVLPALTPQQLFSELPLHNRVPLITGTNRDEMKLFMLGDPQYVRTWFGKIPQARDADTYQRVARYSSELWRVMGADAIAAALVGTQQDNNSQGIQQVNQPNPAPRPVNPPVYTYRFDYDQLTDNWLVSLRDLLGAAHGFEIPYVFGLGEGMGSAVTMHPQDTLAQRQQLADAMSSYWAHFAYSGEPGRGRSGELPLWQPWNRATGPQVMLLDADNRGGIRPLAESLTLTGLKQAMLTDPAVSGNPQALCELWRAVFYRNLFSPWLFDAAEYANLGEQGCAAYPVEPGR
jgi:para-nitrobenzyl esterase